MRNTIAFIALLITSSGLLRGQVQTFFSQPGNSTEYSFVRSSTPTSNFNGTYSLDVLYAKATKLHDIRRSFLKFDLSSIPANAIITSAQLEMWAWKVNGSFPNNMLIHRIGESWSKTTVTYNNQPSLITSNVVEHSNVGNTGWHSFNVKDHVQEMVKFPTMNHGFGFKLKFEVNPKSCPTCPEFHGTKYRQYYSSNYSDAQKRPKLTVKYVLPIEVYNAEVVHATTSGSADGSVDPSVRYGDGGPYTYKWYNSSGALLQSGSTPQKTGLAPGWYGLEVSDAMGNVSHMAFIIGAECSTVSIDFQPDGKYVEDAFIYNLVKNNYDYGNNNYGTYTDLRASRWTNGGVWYSTKSLFRYLLWVDGLLEIKEANFTLYGDAHFPLQRPNQSQLVKVNQSWSESLVTYNNQPNLSTVSSDKVLITGTTNNSQNKVIDIKSFAEQWQASPTSNFGFLLELQNSTQNKYTKMNFHSSDVTTPNLRPKVTFKLTINCRFAQLYKKLNGSFYPTRNDRLNFFYYEEYNDSDSQLNYTIYDKKRNSIQSNNLVNKYGDNRNTLDVSSLPDDNFYILEVQNEKGEKWLLRFKT